MSLVHHVISGLEKHCRSTNQAAILNTSPSYFRKNEAWLSTTYTAGKISSELLDVMLAALQDYVHCHSIHTSTYTEELRASLYDLMDTAGKIFTLLKSPQDRNIDLSSTPDNLLNAELEQRKKKGRMVSLINAYFFFYEVPSHVNSHSKHYSMSSPTNMKNEYRLVAT